MNFAAISGQNGTLDFEQILKGDVIALQEVDYRQERSAAMHIKELAQSLGMAHWVFARTLIGTPGAKHRKVCDDEAKYISSVAGVGNGFEEFPDGLACYGIGIISRLPITKIDVLSFNNNRFGMPLIIPMANKNFENNYENPKVDFNDEQRSGGLPKNSEYLFDLGDLHQNEKIKARIAYVTDEPRVALAVELANKITVINTHLSFIPGVNISQLRKIAQWADNLPTLFPGHYDQAQFIAGDLNLGWNLPNIILHKRGWSSLNPYTSYPAMKPKIKFDYILGKNLKVTAEVIPVIEKWSGVSDHLPISVNIRNI